MKEIIVLGAIGNTPRQNRDNMRIIGRGGAIYALKAHIEKDHPLVVKKYEKDNHFGKNREYGVPK